jgi:hypothetical protein
MADFKKTFADKGYSLFETETIEDAIINAIKNNELRYIYGIPIVIENSDVNYALLIKKAKAGKLLKELFCILNISSKLIKNKKKAEELSILVKGKGAGKLFEKKEFELAYAQSRIGKYTSAFSSVINYQLSFLFATKQIAILAKIKDGERLSKTEKEYYSRVIKKKLIAIKELAPLAASLL